MKHKLLLLVLSLLFISKNVLAYDFNVNGIYYKRNSSLMTVSVTDGESKYSGTVTIPPTVTFGTNTFTVTSIGSYAFANCYSLTSIKIPNGVTSIGSSAFANCYSLTSIKIPNGVTSIGSSAFKGCESLTTVNIPNSVTSIGNETFWGCASLTSIKIPNSVISIGSSAFRHCESLTTVNIPNSVTSIGNSAFASCYSLTSIKIPNSVISIGDEITGNNILGGCVLLTSIYSEIIDPKPLREQFDPMVYFNTTLYVPIGTLEKYKSTNGWKQFYTIVEDPSLGVGTSDINGTSADNLKIKVSNGQITVSGMEDKTLVSVFDINGTHLGSTYSSNGNAVIRTNLPQNTLVIIKIGNKSFKTIMK